jgi:hypothetical protein
MEPVGSRPNGVCSRVHHSVALPIVLGAGLGLAVLVGAVAIFILRQGDAPNKSAALPALASGSTAPAALPPPASALPPLGEAAPDSPSEAIEPERPLAPEPPPIQIGVSQQASLEAAPPLSIILSAPKHIPLPPSRDAAAAYDITPLPPPRPLALAPAPSVLPSSGYDRWTAVYDISAHMVTLPDGTRLEAHSGLGDMEDDPRYVDQRDRGPTPPHLYDLTLRESLFHGVQALRLTPIGDGFAFNRVGLLAHPYMLGPNGDSNGCVSFKIYDVFLRAYMSGEVKRLAVVARRTEDPPRVGPLASLRQDR